MLNMAKLEAYIVYILNAGMISYDLRWLPLQRGKMCAEIYNDSEEQRQVDLLAKMRAGVYEY